MATTADASSFFGMLHDVWGEHGCAICGYTPGPDAPDGFRLEMHSLNRGHGRHDSRDPADYLGLCGELAPEKCHWRVTTHRVELYLNDRGEIVWTDKQGGRDICRIPSEFRDETPLTDAQADAVRGRASAVTTAGGTASGDLEDAPAAPQSSGLEVLEGTVEPATTLSVVPAALTAPAAGNSGGVVQPRTPTSRLAAIRALMGAATRSHLAASLLLLEAFERSDHEEAGCTWSAYCVEHLGIVKGTASKMLLVARTFQGSWEALPDDQQADLSLERLYYAGLLVGSGADPDEALSKAVTQPVAHLIAERKGEEITERRKMVCSECGEATWHSCRPTG